MKKKIPAGFWVGKSHGDGNCLFNSSSIALFGTDAHSSLLRLAAVCNGVEHFDHYLELYTIELKEQDTAQQFVATVASSNRVFAERPKNDPSVRELVYYILVEEVQRTAVEGSYSGLLQIQLLAGAIGRPIQQHSEEDRGVYNLLLLPCCCTDDMPSPIHILWCKMNAQAQEMNHIVPLVPSTAKACQSMPAHPQSVPPITEVLEDTCVMEGAGQCTVEWLTTEMIEWIECPRCHSWYHKPCVGLASDDHDFSCCSVSDSNPIILDGGEKGSRYVLRVSDIQSMYPDRGVSDAMIDFYERQILTKPSENVMLVSSLYYEGIKTNFKVKSQTERQKARRKMMLNQSLIGFPCKPSAYVLDSLSPGIVMPYSINTVEDIAAYLFTNTSPNLQPVALKVPHQSGVECGVHVMHHLGTLAKSLSSESFVAAIDQNGPVIPTARIRGEVLLKTWQLHVESRKHSVTARIRQSERLKKCTSGKKNKLEQVAARIAAKDEEGLQVVEVQGKGRGVVSTRPFKKRDVICEYSGEHITYEEAKRREGEYSRDPSVGCYMYYYVYKDKKFCVDATSDDGRFGRLLNHNRTAPNVTPKLLEIAGKPHLCFVAARDIQPGEMLEYDYGERDKTIIESHPWLKA